MPAVQDWRTAGTRQASAEQLEQPTCRLFELQYIFAPLIYDAGALRQGCRRARQKSAQGSHGQD